MLSRAEEAGVKKFINIGAEMKETRKVAVYDRAGVYKSIGLHPHFAAEGTPQALAELAGYIRGNNVAAVGETGFDFFKSGTSVEEQEKVFRSLLVLAKEANLPVVIHSREAHAQTLAVLKEASLPRRGVIHCFTGDYSAAKDFIDAGYMLGIGGVLTFPNARALRETLKQVGLEHIVLETDGPWLAPQAVRGARNEAIYVAHAAEALAVLKNVARQEIEEVTTRNAEKLFNI
jgi:TatD DNase family protein